MILAAGLAVEPEREIHVTDDKRPGWKAAMMAARVVMADEVVDVEAAVVCDNGIIRSREWVSSPS